MGHDANQSLATNEPPQTYQIVKVPAHTLKPEICNYLKKSFAQNLRNKNEYFKLIRPDAYWEIYPKYIQALINKPTTQVSIAIMEEDTILGWSMYDGHVLHFVHVRKDIRMQGFATQLIPKDITEFTHITNEALRIWPKEKFKHLTFNPFAT